MLRTLETQDYITTPVIPNTNPPNPILMKSTKEPKPIVHPSELPNLNETVNGSNAVRKEHESKRDREMRETRKTEPTVSIWLFDRNNSVDHEGQQ